ncbi:hypothetical protein HDU85_007151 [Gaertneriomyces sp. JEL0708]|nr:hypothetical protein HDU85_007151 [Gaertneriomyces sp. JEL0708]
MFGIYDLLVAFFTLALRGFFREVKTRGSHKIPQAGPVIFCVAPHANQFVDPLMLMTNCGRKVGFLAAKKSMDKPHIGIPARALGSIPVVRAQDLVKRGQGSIKRDSNDHHLIRGINTAFTQEVTPRSLIQLSAGNHKFHFDVVEIMSDVLLKVKKPVEDDEALKLLAAEGGAEFKIVPHVDQQEMFQTVIDRLERGECVGIFPEGGSHDRPELLPLKAGVTLMALGAMQQHPHLNVQIVPVGLNYFNADRFRSRAVIEFGDPITIPYDLVEQFAAGGQQKRQACGILLDTIYTSLKAITTTAPDYETLMVVQAARRLYKPSHKHLDLDQTLQLSRRLTDGYVRFKKDPRVQELTTRVMEYNRLLSYYGIRDHQVNRTGIGRLVAFSRLITRLAELIIFAIVGLPGFLLTAPIWHTARKVASRKMAEAKAGSNVKIWGKDVVATWKVLTTIALIPIFLTFYTLCSFVIAYAVFNYGREKSLAIAGVVSCVLPTITWATIHCYDHGVDIVKSIPPLWLAFLSGSSAEPLRDMREHLQQYLSQTVDELGPEMYGPDFQQMRIVRAEDVDYGLRMAQKLRRGTNFDLGAIDIQWDAVDEREFSDDIFLFKDEYRGVVQGVHCGDVRSRRSTM